MLGAVGLAQAALLVVQLAPAAVSVVGATTCTLENSKTKICGSSPSEQIVVSGMHDITAVCIRCIIALYTAVVVLLLGYVCMRRRKTTMLSGTCLEYRDTRTSVPMSTTLLPDMCGTSSPFFLFSVFNRRTNAFYLLTAAVPCLVDVISPNGSPV